MDPLTAVSLASATVQFVDFSVKVCCLIKEYSGAKGMPEKLLEILEQTEQKVEILKDIGASGRHLSEREVAVPLPVVKDGKKVRWVDRRLVGIKKVTLSIKIAFEEKNLTEFQDALDSVLRLVKFQTQMRTENAVAVVGNTTGALLQRSDRIQDTLNNLQTTIIATASIAIPLEDRGSRTVFLVSQARNAAFVRRDDISRLLDEKFAVTQPTPKVHKAALCGLGGIGKTQIALEYGYGLHTQSPSTSVIWVYAANSTRFEQDYKSIAEEFQLPGRDNPQTDTMELVRKCLDSQYQKSWLLIVDNVDNNDIFAATSTGKICLEYLPERNPNGCILFTSRNREVCLNLIEDPIMIPTMSKSEATTLLGEILSRTCTPSEQLMLLEELDYLPLAITQATRYMVMLRKTVSEYLDQFHESKESKAALLKHKVANPGRRERSMESVASTWIVSFNYIRGGNSRAAEILSLMSLLDRQSIPISLVIGDNENKVLFEIVTSILESFSLITMSDDRKSCSMHRLVQAVTKEWLAAQDQDSACMWGSAALKNLSERFPNGEFDTWPLCSLYMPHVEAVLKLDLESTELNVLGRANLLCNMACYLEGRGRYTSAMAHAKESLELFNEIFPRGCRGSLRVQDQMAMILNNQGNHSLAEQLYRKTLSSLETLLGQDYLDTLRTASNLAYLLTVLGKFGQSKVLALRAVTGRTSQLSADHQHTMQSINILALALLDLGETPKAEGLWRQLIAQWDSTKYGEWHHDNLVSVLNLGVLLSKSKRYEEAEAYLQRALRMSEQIHGLEHLETLTFMYHLGVTLISLGRFGEAESIVRTERGAFRWPSPNNINQFKRS